MLFIQGWGHVKQSTIELWVTSLPLRLFSVIASVDNPDGIHWKIFRPTLIVRRDWLRVHELEGPSLRQHLVQANLWRNCLHVLRRCDNQDSWVDWEIDLIPASYVARAQNKNLPAAWKQFSRYGVRKVMGDNIWNIRQTKQRLYSLLEPTKNEAGFDLQIDAAAWLGNRSEVPWPCARPIEQPVSQFIYCGRSGCNRVYGPLVCANHC